MPKKGSFAVTPWEVKGAVDYDLLIKGFGAQYISDALLESLRRLAGGELHFMLRRKIFFAHRDLDWILDEYAEGNKFVLYTGRGPSGHTHVGHLMPWIMTKWLQDKFDAPLLFQMTDDEKFLFKNELTREQTHGFAYENALDVIALGFDSSKTRIFSDYDYCKTLYPIATEVAKRVTFSTAKAVFGFTNETNIGSIFFTSMQSVPALLPSVEAGKSVPVLIPLAIDQDPHFRVTRDVAPKLGFPKPAIIHSKFAPSLQGADKMSASAPEYSIFTTDSSEAAEKKIATAFTGGRETVEEQRKKGGQSEVCSVFQYFYYIFESDYKAVEERRRKCLGGEILCGECKCSLAEKVKAFLKEHQRKREQARKVIDKFLVKD